MGDNGRYRPPTLEEKHELERLLKEIPTTTIVQVEWQSPEGREFIKELRKISLNRVSVPTIAEALGMKTSTLQGAIAYWERSTGSRPPKTRRVRQRRPLGKTKEDGHA